MEVLKETITGLSADDKAALQQFLAASSPPPQQAQNEPHTQQPFIRKLRLFSGKSPVPAGEVDFESWYILADQVVSDNTLQEGTKKRIVIASLQKPALDMISSYNTSKDIIDVLRTIFGSVKDGRELYIQFLSQMQSHKETASEYLQRLYVDLLEVVDREGIENDNMPKELLEQFLRGTTDETLVIKLKLEEKLTDPPKFPDLLMLMRKEEGKRSHAKIARSAQSVVEEREDALTKLAAQMQQLSGKMDNMESKWKQENRNWKQKKDPEHKKSNFSQTRPTCFCYNCGEIGHKSKSCRNSCNPQKVQEKLLERCKESREKREKSGKHSGASCQSNY